MRVSMAGAAVVIQRWWRHTLWTRNAMKKKRSKYSQIAAFPLSVLGHVHQLITACVHVNMLVFLCSTDTLFASWHVM